jgi:hypothetical protein
MYSNKTQLLVMVPLVAEPQRLQIEPLQSQWANTYPRSHFIHTESPHPLYDPPHHDKITVCQTELSHPMEPQQP